MPVKFFNFDLLFTLTNRAIIIVAGFLTSIITARYLGPTGRGDYFFIITLTATLAQFCNLGLQSSNTYLVARNPQLLPKLTTNSFWIASVIGILFPTIVILSLHLQAGAWLALLLIPTTLFYMLGCNLLVGLQKIKAFNAFQLGSSLFVGGSTGIAAYLQLDSFGFIVSNSIAWLLGTACLLLFLTRYCSEHFTWQFNYATFQQGFGYAARAYIVTLLGLLVLKSNVFLLKHYSDAKTLGYFSIAAQMNDVLSVLPASIGLILFPSLIRNTENRWQQTKYNLIFTSFGMLGLCLCTALLIKPVIHLFFGASYEPATIILLYLLPGTFFLGLTSIVSQYLAALGFPRTLLYVWGIAFLAVMSLSYLFIPYWHAIGAAVALSITYTLLFFAILLLAISTSKKIP